MLIYHPPPATTLQIKYYCTTPPSLQRKFPKPQLAELGIGFRISQFRFRALLKIKFLYLGLRTRMRHLGEGKSFMRIMIHDYADQLQMPPQFVKNLDRRVAVEYKLRVWGCGGSFCWIVKAEKESQGLFLRSGWPEFVQDNNLGFADVLVFIYNGEFNFLVKIFAPSGLMKNMTKSEREEEVVDEDGGQGQLVIEVGSEDDIVVGDGLEEELIVEVPHEDHEGNSDEQMSTNLDNLAIVHKENDEHMEVEEENSEEAIQRVRKNHLVDKSYQELSQKASGCSLVEVENHEEPTEKDNQRRLVEKLLEQNQKPSGCREKLTEKDSECCVVEVENHEKPTKKDSECCLVEVETEKDSDCYLVRENETMGEPVQMEIDCNFVIEENNEKPSQKESEFVIVEEEIQAKPIKKETEICWVEDRNYEEQTLRENEFCWVEEDSYEKIPHPSFTSRHCHFLATWSPTWQHYISVPNDIAQEKDLRQRTRLVVQDLEGKTWILKLSIVEDTGSVNISGKEWSAFCIDKKLKEGDICAFEFLSTRTVRVHILSRT